MSTNRFNLMVKAARAIIIRRHLEASGMPLKVVCFTCGNSAKFLREQNIEVIEVGGKGDLKPSMWFDYSKIQLTFNGMFDATSGHLPIPLIDNIANFLKSDALEHPTFEFKKEVRELHKIHKNYGLLELPTGSGETLVCIKLAFNLIRIKAIYNMGYETKYEPLAPMNTLVHLLKLK